MLSICRRHTGNLWVLFLVGLKNTRHLFWANNVRAGNGCLHNTIVLVIGTFHCLFHSFVHVIQSSIGLTYVSILSKSILVRNLILFVIFSRPTMNNCGYDLVVLKPEDFEQVAVFLDNHFYCFDSRNPLVRIIIFRFDMILLPCFSCLNFVHITTLLLCFRGVARIFRRGGRAAKTQVGPSRQ